MIYAIGLDSDKTYLQFLKLAHESGTEVVPINLRAVALHPWEFSVPVDSAPSRVYIGGDPLTIDPSADFFVRLIDLSTALPGDAASAWRHMLGGLSSFLEVAPGRVVNRPGAHTHNASKPLHEVWLRRQGLQVPASVTSSDPSVLRQFVDGYKDVVVKALSGLRGIARRVTVEEFGSEFDPQSGPVHLQRRIFGHDVRVHMVDGEAFAVRIESDSVDYRAPDVCPTFERIEISQTLVDRLASATAALGLVLAGWDFKVDADGVYWCLEVNPMPGYDMYDRRVNGAITRAILRYLTQS